MLQRFFEHLDKILGITHLPYLFIALIPLAILVTVFVLIFWDLRNHESGVYTITEIRREEASNKINILLLVVYFSAIGYALGELFGSTSSSYFVGSIAFIVAKIAATIALFFISLKCERHYLVLTCLYLLTTLGSLENNLAAPIYTGETVVDTINIYVNGHWFFSFHNPVYDALPYDSVLTVFLMHILGISDPINIFPKILVDVNSSFLLISIMLLFAKRLGGERCRFPLALFTISMPYLTMEIPPINFGIVFSALVIFLMFKKLKQQTRWDGLLLVLFFGCGILAHPLSVTTLLPMLMLSLLFELKGKQGSGSGRVKSPPIIVCAIIYFTYLVYTASLEATYGYLRRYLVLERSIVFTFPLNLFTDVPNFIKLFYTPFLAPSLAWLIYHFLQGVVNQARGKKFKLLREDSYDALILLLCISELIFGATATFPLLAGEEVNRHLAIAACVCGAFATFPVFLFAFDKALPKKLIKLLLVTLLLITVGGVLTPHKMFDQYVWPPLHNGNDYRISEWLMNHGPGLTNQYDITIVVNGSWGMRSPSPPLHISAFKHAITNQTLPRYHVLPYLDRVSVISGATELDFGNSSSKIYGTLVCSMLGSMLEYEIYVSS